MDKLGYSRYLSCFGQRAVNVEEADCVLDWALVERWDDCGHYCGHIEGCLMICG